MLGTNENHRVEDSARNSYDVRIGTLETDVAVIRNSFATKDDIQALRAQMQAGHERILTLLYEHKLAFHAALAEQREYFHAALAGQREEFYGALARQREEFNAALAKQREDFYAALAQTKIDLHQTLMSHMWKLYGFASLMLGGVYFIARYVH